MTATGHREATGPAREAWIQGLESLAAFLRDNPGIPIWRGGQEIQARPADGVAGVERVAALLGAEAERRPEAVRVTRKFGPHSYVVYAPREQPQAGAA